MDYPLNLRFKRFTLAPQISVTDATGKLVLYVKQKAFKLKEAVTVFADAEQKQALYTINADRVMDFSARYNISDTSGQVLGSMGRQGMRSLWKAHYDVAQGGQTVFSIREANPWVKVVDGLVGEIPIIGLFTGYMFHPAYLVSRPDGTVVMRLEKKPALTEGRYTIENLAAREDEERLVVLSLMMLTLLERDRG